MKKNKLYTVTKYNRPAFMPDFNTYDAGGDKMMGWASAYYDKNPNLYDPSKDMLQSYAQSKNAFGISKQNNPFSKMNMGSIFSKGSSPLGGAIGAAGSVVNKLGKKIISGGYNSGVGNAVANVGGTVGGIVSNFNPVLGGIISAGTGIIGGGVNALFGSKVDEKKLADINKGITYGRNFVSKAGTFEDIKGPEAFMTDTNAYSSGILARGKAARKNAELRNQLFDAMSFADRSVQNNIYNIWDDQVNDALFNYAAFGGPLNTYGGALGLMQNDKYIDAINNRTDAIMGKNNNNNTLGNPQTYFGDGGGIHIAPSKKGTFTAAASKHGMGVQEFASKVLANKDDYSPAMVKKANFARNASKWHAFGGELGTNGTDWTNGLLYVDAGGTHQQNPLGGVPIGFDQNGTPNLVEEGETIWNDYVFSDRMKVPKAMFHTLGLGGAMKKGLTFAHASKRLAKESEQRPNDPISMAGLEMSLSKLAAVQEAERMKKQMREHVGMAGNEAAYGGPLGNVFAGPGDRENIIKSIPKEGEINGVHFDDIMKYPGRIESWLRANYYNLEEEDIADIANTVYRNHLNNEREKEFLEDAGVSDADALSNIERVGMQMALDNPFEIGPIYSQTLSKWKQKPIFDMSEANFEEHIRKAMRAGMTFDEAWRYVDADRIQGSERTRSRIKERMREDLENDLKTISSSNTLTDKASQETTEDTVQSTAPSATNQSSSEVIDNSTNIIPKEQVSTNTLPGTSVFSGPIDTYNLENMVMQAQNQAASAPRSGSSQPGIGGSSSVGRGNTYRNVGKLKEDPQTAWRNYVLPGLNKFIDSWEDRINNAATQGEKDALIDQMVSDFNGLQKSYNDYVWPNIGKSGYYYDPNVENHQKDFSRNYGNTGFFVAQPDGTAIDAIGQAVDKAGSMGDNPDDGGIDGYNGPNTAMRNFGATMYGDADFYKPIIDRFRNLGADYKLSEDLKNGNDALYVLSRMAPQASTPEAEAAEGEAAKVSTDTVNGEPQVATDTTNTGTTTNNPVNEKRPLLDARLRYAPVVGGALGVFGDLLGLTNKPDYTYADKLEAAANAAGYVPQIGYKPVGDYMRYTPFDRLFYANQLQANARGTDRMLANTSSPSRAAGLLANAYNTNNALGNLYRQGDEYNLAQYQQVKDFNRKTNMFNSQMGLEADIANARYRQAAKQYQLSGLAQAAALRDSIDQRVGAARSANLTNFFNSLGNIGRENFIFNQINQDPSRSYTYQDHINGGWGYLPRFMQDAYQKDVEAAAQRMMEEERKKAAEAQKATQPASGAYGGKLKRNKK